MVRLSSLLQLYYYKKYALLLTYTLSNGIDVNIKIESAHSTSDNSVSVPIKFTFMSGRYLISYYRKILGLIKPVIKKIIPVLINVGIVVPLITRRSFTVLITPKNRTNLIDIDNKLFRKIYDILVSALENTIDDGQ